MKNIIGLWTDHNRKALQWDGIKRNSEHLILSESLSQTGLLKRKESRCRYGTVKV